MEPQKTDLETTPEIKPAKSYSKRPLWQWVLLYVVLAIIVYGAIYLLFIRQSGGSTGTFGY